MPPCPQVYVGHPERSTEAVQTTETLTKLHLGKLRLERRRGGPFIYAKAFLQGRFVGKSTGEETLNAAAKVAEKWYLEQLLRVGRGEQLHGRSFEECAEAFLTYADTELVNEISDGPFCHGTSSSESDSTRIVTETLGAPNR